jgi:CBS domain-containing protein
MDRGCEELPPQSRLTKDKECAIMKTITAGEVMTGFVAAEPSDTLGEIAEKMREANAGSALVIDYGRLVGILTSRDMLRAVAERTHSSEARARTWMTPGPRVARADTPAEEASLIMVEQGCHHLPVVDTDGRPIGVVGMRSVVSRTIELDSGMTGEPAGGEAP